MQTILTHTHGAAVSSSTSNFKQDLSQKSPRSTRNNVVIRNQTDKPASSKPILDSGSSYDAKLVEMINTAIVDRSPSVKWDDVGEQLFLSLFLSFSVSFACLQF